MVNNTIIVDDTMMSESTQNTSNTSLTTNSLRNIEEYLDTELMKTDNIKTELFKSLILQLQDQVETLKEERNFLKAEITHKNSLISLITTQNAKPLHERSVVKPNKSSVYLDNMVIGNDADALERDVMPQRKNMANQNLWSSIDDESSVDQHVTSTIQNSTFIGPSSPKTLEAATRKINLENQMKHIRELRHYDYLNRTRNISSCERTGSEGDEKLYHYSEYIKSAPEPTTTNEEDMTYQLGSWEKYNRGFATKMMKRMGYNGRGLGKFENGIIEPISIHNIRTKDTDQMTQSKVPTNKESDDRIEKGKMLFYVISSSMLNQMDGERLSNKDV